jgi:hypothetical protein
MSIECMLTYARVDIPYAYCSIGAAAHNQIIGHFTTPDTTIMSDERLLALVQYHR